MEKSYELNGYKAKDESSVKIEEVPSECADDESRMPTATGFNKRAEAGHDDPFQVPRATKAQILKFNVLYAISRFKRNHPRRFIALIVAMALAFLALVLGLGLGLGLRHNNVR